MRDPLVEALRNYNVTLRVTLQEADVCTWDEEIREVAPFTAEETRRFRQELAEPIEWLNQVAYGLVERLGMTEWFEVRDSLGIVVCIESMEEGDQLEPFDLSKRPLREGGVEQPNVFSTRVDPSQRLWNSPEFKTQRCLMSAFLGRYKEKLETRRITSNTLLSFELWRFVEASQKEHTNHTEVRRAVGNLLGRR